MMRVQVAGALVNTKDTPHDYTHCRLVMEDDKPVHLLVRKEKLRELVRNAPHRSHVSVTGLMHASCKFSGDGTPYVYFGVEVESLQCFQTEKE